MRKRLFCVGGGAFLGLGLNPVLGPMVGLEGVVSMAALAGGGAVIGYLASIFLDVFMSDEGKLNLHG